MSEPEARPSPHLCPNCGGSELFARSVAAGASDGIYLLPGLGRFLHYAEFDVVVCTGCGLTRLFAEPAARQNVRTASGWRQL